jgi:hypothetical protein
MAIIVEEPKPPRNWGTIIGVIIIIVILFSGVYFLFFQKPILIETVIPTPIQETQKLSKITFDLSSIQNSDVFKTLRQYSAPATVGQLGRPNPFLPF